MQSLSGVVALAQGTGAEIDAGADVTVVTGSNFAVVVHHGSVGGTTTTVPSASTFGPPSPALQALPAYDPRTCPSS